MQLYRESKVSRREKKGKITFKISRTVTVTRHYLIFQKIGYQMKADNICDSKHLWNFTKKIFLIALWHHDGYTQLHIVSH